MTRRSTFVLLAATTLLWGHAAAAPLEEEAVRTPTFYRVLVGRPDAAAGAGSVVVVPGPVELPGQASNAAAQDVLRVIDELIGTYRLATIEPAQASMIAHVAGEPHEIQSVAGGPRLESTLVSSDAKSATYKIAISENGKLLAEPVIRGVRGGRAVVGVRNGDAAPYLFLVVEPLPPLPDDKSARRPNRDGVTQPRILNKVTPVYPDAAQKAKFEGLVLVMATVGADGRVTDVQLLRGEPLGLSESAVAAVKQWRFEPARDAAGTAVDVQMTLTIRFALQ
jgi:TonB family protein